MATTTTTKTGWMTADEYIRAAPPAVLEQFERVAGRWKEREVAGWDHQETGDELVALFKRRGHRASGGVRVIFDAENWIVPDVLVIASTNPVRPGGAVYRGVPDLVVEILAADNDAGEDLPKKLRCAAAGVRYYWLARLKWGTLETFRLIEGEYVALTSGKLEPLEALPVPDDL